MQCIASSLLICVISHCCENGFTAAILLIVLASEWISLPLGRQLANLSSICSKIKINLSVFSAQCTIDLSDTVG